ncbi:Thioesterase domain-containing protein [Tenacibaculum sp. 190524A02b]|uniref:thioesterase II family protein n=1 Tax=Tenacibaculum vairaonense TaxID=3137860 RepID=UPI0032B163A5
MRIIAFPFAGGNSYSFKFLEEALAKNKITIEAVEYPGRGNKISEPLTSNIGEIIKKVIPQVLQKVMSLKENEPYMLYGHSMGGLIAYLTAIELAKTKLPKPKCLVVSGKSAPAVKYNRGISKMTSEDFWNTMKKVGGTPDELLNNEILKEFYEPIIKSDYKAVEDYEYKQERKLKYPIDVFYGRDDIFPLEQMLPWVQETTEDIKTYELSGGHFFIYDHVPLLVEHFTSVFKSKDELIANS